MGSVPMKSSDTVWYKGIPLGGTWHCLYCDQCGTFKIAKQPTTGTILWIIAAGAIAIGFGRLADSDPLFVVVLCFAVQLWFLSAAEAFTVSYKCKKCGNTSFTIENVLQYPEYNESVLDIPYDRTVTFFTDEGSGY